MTELDLTQLRSTVDALMSQRQTVPFQALVATAALCRETRLTMDLAASAQVGFPIVVLEREREPIFWAKLTSREREVARLIARGQCNKDIARTLGLSVATVKDHVHAVLLKSGLSSRLEVASAFIVPG